MSSKSVVSGQAAPMAVARLDRSDSWQIAEHRFDFPNAFVLICACKSLFSVYSLLAHRVVFPRKVLCLANPSIAARLPKLHRCRPVRSHLARSLGIGYESFDPKLRDKVVAQFPRVDFHRQIAQAFYDGFGYKPQTTEGTCNEDICSHFARNYKRSNFYEQTQNSAFPNS